MSTVTRIEPLRRHDLGGERVPDRAPAIQACPPRGPDFPKPCNPCCLAVHENPSSCTALALRKDRQRARLTGRVAVISCNFQGSAPLRPRGTRSVPCGQTAGIGAFLRRAAAYSVATAQDARRVRTESAREVRMIGTRAPRTMPPRRHGPGRSGSWPACCPPRDLARQGSAPRPATGETMPLIARRLGVDRVVEGQRPVKHPPGDLPAVGHLAQRRCLDGRRNLRRHRLHRRQDRHARLPCRCRSRDRSRSG